VWKIQASNNKQLPQQHLPQRAVPLFAQCSPVFDNPATFWHQPQIASQN
jgi:hypothetical protein